MGGKFEDRGGKPGLGAGCPHVLHALKLRQHGDLEGARDTALLAVDADMNNAEALALLSAVYGDMEEPWHSQEAARQAVRCAPDRGDFRLLLGVRLLEAGSAGEALQQFDWAAESSTTNGVPPGAVEFNRAVALAKLGRADDAVAAVTKAVSIEPGLYDAVIETPELVGLQGHARFPEAPPGWTEPD